DLGRNLRALHLRRAGRDMLAVARDEHGVERDLVARLRVEQRHLDGDSGLGPELSTTGRKYRVAHRRGTLIGIGTLVKLRTFRALYVVRGLQGSPTHHSPRTTHHTRLSGD